MSLKHVALFYLFYRRCKIFHLYCFIVYLLFLVQLCMGVQIAYKGNHFIFQSQRFHLALKSTTATLPVVEASGYPVKRTYLRDNPNAFAAKRVDETDTKRRTYLLLAHTWALWRWISPLWSRGPALSALSLSCRLAWVSAWHEASTTIKRFSWMGMSLTRRRRADATRS